MAYLLKLKKIQLDNEEISLNQVKMNGNSSMHIEKNFSVLHLIGK